MTAPRKALASGVAALLVMSGPLAEWSRADPPALKGSPAGSSSQRSSTGLWDGPFVIARTSRGTAVQAWRSGPAGGRLRLVVIGQVHGNEPGGVKVVDALRDPGLSLAGVGGAGEATAVGMSKDLTIWLIRTLNPDGARRGRRVNDRGVDLNRNFPTDWAPQGARTGRWSGPAAASEPEVTGLMAFLDQIRPDAVLVLHQDYAAVDISHARSQQAGRALAQLLDLPARSIGCPGPCHGTLSQWVDAEFGAIALTIELPGTVNQADVQRDAGAILRFGTWLAGGSGR